MVESTQESVNKDADRDVFDTYFACITACDWLGGEDIECVSRCVEVHLKEEHL